MAPGGQPITNYTPYNFNPIGGQFYSLGSAGEIRGLTGPGGGACNNALCPHWAVLGNDPDTVELAASGGKLYRRETTGEIREFTGVQCKEYDQCPEWTLLDKFSSPVQIVSGAGKLYQLRSNGSISRFNGIPCVTFPLPSGVSATLCTGWELLDNSSETIEIVASNVNLFQRQRNGNIWKFTGTPCSGNSCPGWQLIAKDSRTVDLVAGGSSLYMFQKLGAIWKFTGLPCDTSGCPGWQMVAPDNNGLTKQVAAGSGELYRLHTNGEIWRYTGSGQNWVMVDAFSGNVEIAASSNGLLVRRSLGEVFRHTGGVCSNGSCPGWIQIARPNIIAITGARP